MLQLLNKKLNKHDHFVLFIFNLIQRMILNFNIYTKYININYYCKFYYGLIYVNNLLHL